MDEATKTELMEQFRLYLDATAEQDDTGAAESIEQNPRVCAPDLFTLLSEVAALKGEVKLESRQFKSALDDFRTLLDSLNDANQRLGAEHERHREQDRAAERTRQRELLLELLDLRDRMNAGQALAGQHRPGWFGGKKKAKRLIASLAEGMGMNVRRLDEILHRRGVAPLPALGQPFDPHSMHATELAQDPHRRHGEVVGEIRPGWLLHNELLRTAEVIVNRLDSPAIQEAPE